MAGTVLGLWVVTIFLNKIVQSFAGFLRFTEELEYPKEVLRLG